LQPKIDAAIDLGVARLLRTQQRDGSWAEDQREYEVGQTALSVYTLLKSDLPPNHPAVRRALLFLRARTPRETYSLGCTAMAYAAANDPADKKRLQALADELLAHRIRGLHSYPFGRDDAGWTDQVANVDLSNTQYAALGLRAAAKAGAKVPMQAWIVLAEAVMASQHKAKDEQIVDDGYGRKVPAAGWGYTPGAKPYGSMTASGAGTLAICREMLANGGMSVEFDVKTKNAMDRGLAWLAAKFDAATNPDHDPAAYYVLYWLYSVERVGAFLGMELLGTRPWYLEGAREILKRQQSDGHVRGDGHGASDTCFAVLFLQRATARTTGGSRGRKPPTFSSEDASADVRFRATGGDDGGPMAFFVVDFSEAATAYHGGGEGAPIRGLRVLRVEWLIDGAVVATTPGDPKRGRTTENYAARWQPPRRGKFQLNAKVTFVASVADPDQTGITTETEGQPVEIEATQVFEPWMEDAARMGTRNLLNATNVEATASTVNNDSQKAKRVHDGLEGTSWGSKPDDPRPAIALTLKEPLKADTLTLTHFHAEAHALGGTDVVTKVGVKLNGGPETVYDLEADPYRPSRLPLGGPKVVRKIEIAILARVPGRHWPGNVGFAEIGLELAGGK
jgi:hypothetical protein